MLENLLIGVLLGNAAVTMWQNYRLRQQNEHQRKTIEHNILALSHQQKALADRITHVDHRDLGPLLSLLLDAQPTIPLTSAVLPPASRGYQGFPTPSMPFTGSVGGPAAAYGAMAGQASSSPSVFPQAAATHRDILKILENI